MNVTVQIPDQIFHALRAGAGRFKLQRHYDLSQADARYYVKLFERQAALAHTAIVLTDLHAPYHCPETLEVVLSHCEALQPERVIALGDMVDFYKVSFWKQDPSRMSFKQEIEQARTVLQMIATRFAGCSLVYLEGNHEERLNSYLWGQAPELYGLDNLTVPALLHLKEMGWEYISNKARLERGNNPYEFAGFVWLHGHEVRSLSQVNIPRSYYQKLKKPVGFGHCHTTQDYYARVLHGYEQAHAIGCLCELNPRFAPVNEWNHGFAEVSWGDGWSIVRNRRVYNNHIL